ncbi:glycosyltransferase [Thiomicrospira sp. S5]|uniref:glycosyltransferase n=1 Tax=Thiomicrospira sp. S5 TaxID=1803865 RepID=UPI000F8A05BA|nr:glycosyltransferase [Thiomicrospira sp. S5]AZR81760.1 group 1 glycosyl transferase [Thiomicrospira sp. S5]
MKVCLFTDTLGDLNGVSRFIQDMGEQAAQHSDEDFDLQIVTATAKPIPDTPYIHNLPCRFRLPMPFYQELDLVYPNTRAIRHFLESYQPDHVHISTPGPFGWAAKRQAEKLGLPLFGTYHTDFPAYLYDLTRSHWVKKQTDNTMAKFYRAFQHVFSRSDAYLGIMQQDLKLPREHISTLFPGTNLAKFHPKHQRRQVWSDFDLEPQRLKVLYVGRINIEKNVPFLLETWQALLAEFPDLPADLILVGEGRFRKWAPKMKPHHIHFLGPIRNAQTLSELYASSDLFVFPSVTDTLGQVIMEAQASGLGCLVSNVGGPQTLIDPNQTGQVLEANHLDTWKNALHEALTKDDIRRQWAQNSRPNIEQYDIVKSFRQFRATHLTSEV